MREGGVAPTVKKPYLIRSALTKHPLHQNKQQLNIRFCAA
jgi:hypothetical protein